MEMSLHPVHIINDRGKIQPTAFIPFCSFGGNMDIMGQKVEGFSMPVCRAFKPSLFRGKKCYALDINEKLSSQNIKLSSSSSHGLTFLVDNNLERHFGSVNSKETDFLTNFRSFGKAGQEGQEFTIYLDTLEPFELHGGGELAMTDIQEIKGTSAYYDYAEKQQLCQNADTMLNCSAREFTKDLLEECQCIPFELLQLLKSKDVNMCTPIQRSCYLNLLKNHSFCSDLLKRCTGFYTDIRVTQYNGNSVLSKTSREAKSMIHDYEKHKGSMMANFHGTIVHPNGLIVSDKPAIRGCRFLLFSNFSPKLDFSYC